MTLLAKVSFAKGEIAPALYARVDVAAYNSALRTARNCIIHSSGGVSNRMGFEYVAPCRYHNAAPRLVKFQFNADITYMLEFGNLYMRVFRDGAAVLETDRNITGATQANPCVITAVAHGFANGNEVEINGVGGMTRLNGRRFIVQGVTANTFQLTHQVTGANINSTGFGAYTAGGVASRVFTLATPYITEELPDLKFTQNADTITITHNAYTIGELTRTGHTSWTLLEPTFAPEQPFPTGLTVTPATPAATTHSYKVTAINSETLEESLSALNNVTRVITGVSQANPGVVTSVAHGFANGDEIHIAGITGMIELNDRRFIARNVAANTFELEGENTTSYAAWTAGGTANQTFVTIANSNAANDNTVAWTAAAGATRYSVYRLKNGVYGYIGDTETTSFVDSTPAGGITPNLGIAPPKARDPFIGVGAQPGCSGFYEQRRAFGGTVLRPDTSFYSQTGAIANYTLSFPTQADDAITATLASNQVNEIRHYVPGKDLIVLTSGAEWAINAGTDAAFSAATIRQKPQSSYGSSHIAPIVSGTTILYVEPGRQGIRSLGYNLNIDGYAGSNLLLFASHLLEKYSVVDWDYARFPDPLVPVVRSDGKMMCLTFNPQQEVIAWTTWDTLGKYKSVSSVRDTGGEGVNRIYTVVNRLVDGNQVFYIETSRPRFVDDVRDCFFVDSGLSLDNPVTITGTTAANPVVVTAPSHGFSNGDEIDISDIVWTSTFDATFNEIQPAQLNDTRFTIANVAANTFELSGINGTGFAAYVEGGKARKAVTSITGLDHLEGRAVVVLANGNVISSHTVSAGAITLAAKASRVHVGLRFITDIELLDIEFGGTVQGLMKKVPGATLRVDKSRGLLYGPSSARLKEIKQREFEVMDQPTKLKTGDIYVTFPSEWNLHGRAFFRQKDPLPITLLGVFPTVITGDK